MGLVPWGGATCTKPPKYQVGQLVCCRTHLGKVAARAADLNGVVQVRQWVQP